MTEPPDEALAAVSVIIPVKDDDRIFACVDSVLACAPEAAALQLLVVDNNSAPAFSKRLQSLCGRVTLLSESRPGAYAARNAAVAEATGSVVFFTDADCVIHPGWIREGLLAIATAGADIILGRSGQVGEMTPTQRLIYKRGDARLRHLRPGDPIEVDTKNMAVRRAVFDRLRFNDAYRRASDTEFGLVAETLGFRVAYWPAMRVDHDHDTTLAIFAAKQACHGWGAQRIMRDCPEIEWHGGHLRQVARVSNLLARVPFRRQLSRGIARGVVLAAKGLDRLQPGRLPFRAAYAGAYCIDKAAAAAGHLMYEAGTPEPSVSDLLRRQVPRD